MALHTSCWLPLWRLLTRLRCKVSPKLCAKPIRLSLWTELARCLAGASRELEQQRQQQQEEEEEEEQQQQLLQQGRAPACRQHWPTTCRRSWAALSPATPMLVAGLAGRPWVVALELESGAETMRSLQCERARLPGRLSLRLSGWRSSSPPKGSSSSLALSSTAALAAVVALAPTTTTTPPPAEHP